MSNFLNRLIQRHSGTIPTVQPRRPSMFAQESPDDWSGERQSTALESDSTPVQPAQSIAHPTRVVAQPSEHTERRHRPAAPRDTAPPFQEQPAPLQSIRHQDTSDVPSPERPGHSVSEGAPHSPRQVTDLPAARRSDRLSAPSPENGDRSTSPSALVRTEGAKARQPIDPIRLLPAHPFTGSETSQAPAPLLPSGHPDRRQGRPGTVSFETPVQVTIGRIEVSAVTAPAQPKRSQAARQPSMTLQEYLSKRRGRGR